MNEMIGDAIKNNQHKLPFNDIEVELRDMILKGIAKSKYKDFGKQAQDNVNHPNHYVKGGLECIKVIKAQLTKEQYQGYLYGNVLKYMWRWQDKNGLEDLRKAEHYLKWLIEEVEKNGGNRKEVKN